MADRNGIDEPQLQELKLAEDVSGDIKFALEKQKSDKLKTQIKRLLYSIDENSTGQVKF